MNARRYTLLIVHGNEWADHWRDVVSFVPQRWGPGEPVYFTFADGHKMTVFPGAGTVIVEEDVSAWPARRRRTR